jgi:2-keto-4-pentenoate hydratase/2-oxohepta-3-ene-1,7-dioic acid hydratase in catechol pathway
VKLIRYRTNGVVRAGVVMPEGVVGIKGANDLLEIIQSGTLPEADRASRPVPLDQVTPLLPYDVPPKIWCIGLNYKSHAEDIQAVQPEEPGSFMKPASALFPPEGDIVLPPEDVSNDVDAEGELAIVIGKTCKHVTLDNAPDVIFGYTTTLDLTALDILKKNPRYLTRAKSMDTFFSFGPVIVTADEIADVNELEVITEHNDGICSRDFVRNMKHGPYKLVSFHSEHMTLHPGDIISTGCPKGARIKAGDRVRSRIDGLGTLGARVTQGRRVPYTGRGSNSS